MTSGPEGVLAKARHSSKKKRSKRKLVTLAVASILAGGAFTAIGAGASFATDYPYCNPDGTVCLAPPPSDP